MYKDNQILKDYTLHYLNITKANSVQGVPRFDFGYNASSFYNVSHLHEYDKFSHAVDRLNTDDDFFLEVQKIFFGYSNPVKYFMPKNVDNELRRFLYCRFYEDTFDSYSKCIGNGKTWEEFDAGMRVSEKLSGKWHIRKEFN